MSGHHAAELRGLREALRSQQSTARSVVSTATPTADVAAMGDSQLIELLRELKDGLVTAIDSADEVAVTHPVLSVGAAFLLGLAVGRLMKGL